MSFKSSLLKTTDVLFGPIACGILSRSQRNAEFRHADDVEGAILLIRPGGIGDAILLLPVLKALRSAFPDRRIDMLCESRNREVFQLGSPDVNVVAYDVSPITALRMLRKTTYGIVIDTEQFHNFSAVMTALTRAPLRIGFKINTHRRGLYTHLVSYDLDGPEDAQFGRLLNAAFGHDVPLPSRQGIIAQDALPELPPEHCLTSPFFVVHAGGSIPPKRIPEAILANACQRAAASTGLAIVIIGSSADAAYAATLATAIGPAAANLCGRLSLPQTATVCHQAEMLVGPDSGIAHLAVAVGTPTVAVFGPSDPAKWGPPRTCGQAVSIALPCSPCSIFGYTKPCANYECTSGITADQITNAILQTLKKKAPHQSFASDHPSDVSDLFNPSDPTNPTDQTDLNR